jgi:plasmid maintenance system antidote protein VapI
MNTIEYFTRASGKPVSHIAKKMKVSRVTVYNMFKGQWTKKTVRKLAKVLDVKPLDLIRSEFE